MTYYDDRTFQLSSNKLLLIRQPSVDTDLERFHQFVRDLPESRKNYLRYDLTDPWICRQRLEQANGIDLWRLFGELDGQIVASATLERQPFRWSHHVAELRMLVVPRFNHLGIGDILLSELVTMGFKAGVERLFSEVMAEHKGAQDKLKNHGFVQEGLRAGYARDTTGKLHDVVIMSNDLREKFMNLEEMIYEMDCQFSSGL